MNLGGKSLMVNPRKTLTLVLAIALVAASLGALLAVPARVAQAQGTITLSSSNLNPYKIVELTINLPGVDVDRVRIRVLDKYGIPVTLSAWNGSQLSDSATEFYAKKLGPGTYIAYLAGHEVDSTKYPRYPKVVLNETTSSTTYSYYAKLAQDPGTGATLTVEVLGYGVTTTISYAAVASTLAVDRTTIPVRTDLYNSTMVTLTITDQDLNWDPTATDSLAPGNFSVNVTLIKKETTGQTIGPKIVGLTAFTSINETAANSGAFKITLTVWNITQALDEKLDKGDLLIIEVASNITNWGDGTYNDYELKDSKTLTAVYNYPTISIDFTSQYLTITITSPDDNVNAAAKDNLGRDVTLSGFVSQTIPGNKFRETGANTGIFTYKLSVKWNISSSVDVVNNVVTLKRESPSFTVTVEYLNMTASATYYPVAPDVSVVKATARAVALNVVDQDLNNDPNVLERLMLSSITNGVMAFTKDGVTLYEVTVRDSAGTILLRDANATGYAPSFIETDVNSNTFRLTLPATYTDNTGASKVLFSPGKTYTIELTDYTGTGTGSYKKTITVTIAAIKVELDRSTYPINRDKNVNIYVTLYDDRLNKDTTIIDRPTDGTLKYYVYNPTTNKYINPDTGATSDNIVENNVTGLEETGPNTGVFEACITINCTKVSPAWIGAKIVVYKSGEPDYKAEAKFDVYQVAPGDLSVDKTVVPRNGTIVLTVYDPDANVDSTVKDTVNVVVYIDGVKQETSLILKETDVNTGRFTYIVSVYSDLPSAGPGSTIKFEYEDKTPIRSPTATDFGPSIKVSVTVKVASFTGSLSVPKDWIGPYEIMTIRVTDQDLDVDPTVANTATVSVLIEGFAESKDLTLTETGVNTGVFEGKFSLGWWKENDVNRILPVDTIREDYIGKKVTIMYVDAADETGSRKVNVATLTIKAVDAEISVDKEAVNVGQVLTITVKNLDIAQNPEARFRQVLLRSTTYPTGITSYASEVEPGVYQVKVTVVSLDAWTPGAPQIPAKLGDTITIVYKDPIAADGTEKSFTKTVVVGVPVERPVPASEQKFLDVTGAEKKVGKVGETVMLSTKVQNVDVVDREFTAIFQVKDERGAVVYIAWVTAKLAPGTSMTPAVSWTPAVKGTYTVEVLVVKSIAEPTPYSDKISAPFTVQ
jgi:hypothetical protein